MMFEMTDEILMLAAIVTSYIGVFKAYGVPSKHFHAISLVIATVFVLVPEKVKEILTMISLIGLTASGAYQWSKGKKDETNNEGKQR